MRTAAAEAHVEIRIHPSPILRTASIPVESTWTSRRVARELADSMLDVIDNTTAAAGLAAQQVGRLLRVFAWNASGLRTDHHALANAFIIDRLGTSREQESCLSLPGVAREKARARVVRIRGYCLFSRQDVELTLHGLEARIVQHAVEHLDGVLFTDRRARP